MPSRYTYAGTPMLRATTAWAWPARTISSGSQTATRRAELLGHGLEGDAEVARWSATARYLGELAAVLGRRDDALAATAEALDLPHLA